MTNPSLQGIRNRLFLVETQIALGLSDGVRLAGEHILGESNAHVPHEEATLERSGKVTVEGATIGEGIARAAVSYDTPYAVVQHEDLTLSHDAGRTAKYLENAGNSERGVAADIVAQAVRTRLDRIRS